MGLEKTQEITPGRVISTYAFLKTSEVGDDFVTTYMSCFFELFAGVLRSGGMRTGRDRFGLHRGVKRAFLSVERPQWFRLHVGKLEDWCRRPESNRYALAGGGF